MMALLLMTFAAVTAAADYEFLAEEVAEGVWVVPGTTEGFSRDNGGHMMNTGFVVTDEGAVIVDPGPTLRYGEQLRALAESKAGGAIARVYLTHHHPDHALGALAFSDVPVHALPATIAALERDGQKLLNNFYRLLGDWMRGTRVHLPTQSVEPGQVEIAFRHRLRRARSKPQPGRDLSLHRSYHPPAQPSDDEGSSAEPFQLRCAFHLQARVLGHAERGHFFV